MAAEWLGTRKWGWRKRWWDARTLLSGSRLSEADESGYTESAAEVTPVVLAFSLAHFGGVRPSHGLGSPLGLVGRGDGDGRIGFVALQGRY